MPRTLFRLGEMRSAFENPNVPLSSAALSTMLGGTPTDAGVTISEETAMTLTVVYRCVNFLSSLVAGLPLKVYKDGTRDEVTARPSNNVGCLTGMTSGITQFERNELMMVHLLLWGNAYFDKIRTGISNRIVELRPIHPSRCTPQGTIGNKTFEVHRESGKSETLTPDEILHIPGLSYDGIKGISPIMGAKQAISIGIAADKLAAHLYGNGALLSGILTTEKELGEDEARAIKKRWQEKNAGVSHAHDIAVLGAGASFQAISMPPEAMQFLQSRRWQAIDIARFFGVPPHLAGDVERTTSWGTGIEQQNIAFISYTLRAWLTRAEQHFTGEIITPQNQYAEFLVDGLLRGDTAARYNAYALGIQWGWMTRNEARAKENLPPIDGLDEPLTPSNMQLGVMGEQDAPGAAPGTDPQAAGQDDSPTDPLGLNK